MGDKEMTETKITAAGIDIEAVAEVGTGTENADKGTRRGNSGTVTSHGQKEIMQNTRTGAGAEIEAEMVIRVLGVMLGLEAGARTGHIGGAAEVRREIAVTRDIVEDLRPNGGA